jgi:hypothetical protein
MMGGGTEIIKVSAIYLILADYSLHCALSNCSLARGMAIAVMLAQLSAGIMI